jgi:hypothetical protein
MKVKAASQQLPFSQAAMAALYLAQGLGTMGSAARARPHDPQIIQHWII